MTFKQALKIPHRQSYEKKMEEKLSKLGVFVSFTDTNVSRQGFFSLELHLKFDWRFMSGQNYWRRWH